MSTIKEYPIDSEKRNEWCQMLSEEQMEQLAQKHHTTPQMIGRPIMVMRVYARTLLYNPPADLNQAISKERDEGHSHEAVIMRFVNAELNDGLTYFEAADELLSLTR